MAMQTHPVTSTNIAEVGYDPDERTMRVKFRNGTSYDYFDVSQDAVDKLLEAGSIGAHFQREVRGRYKFARVEEKSDG